MTFTYVVTNTGDTYLSNVQVWDDNGTAGDKTDDFRVGTLRRLAPGASQTLTKTLSVFDDRTNVAVAWGNPTNKCGKDLPGINHVCDKDDAIVDIVNPSVQIIKTPLGVPDGQIAIIPAPLNVTFTYLVTNTGDTFLSNVTVIDDNGTTNPGDDFVVGTIAILGPGQSAYLYATVFVASARTNVALVSGDPSDRQGDRLPGIDRVTDQDDASVAPVVYIPPPPPVPEPTPTIFPPVPAPQRVPVIVQEVLPPPIIDLVSFGGSSMPPAAITGIVFHDRNDNGVQDDEELGIPGVTVWLAGTGTGPYLQDTDNTGAFTFRKVPPGVYQLNQDQPYDHVDSGVIIGDHGGFPNGYNRIEGIRLPGGSFARGYQFADVQPGQISGFVYVDANNNGLLDANERGIEGMPVTLQGQANRGQSISAVHITDDNGFYEFANLLPGSYQLSKTRLPPFIDGQVSVGTLGGSIQDGQQFHSIDLLGGDEGTDYNFGQLEPSTLAGLVYQDPNQNDVPDEGERGLAGVTVIVNGVDHQGNRVFLTATTDQYGQYTVEGLPPGTYEVSLEGHECDALGGDPIAVELGQGEHRNLDMSQQYEGDPFVTDRGPWGGQSEQAAWVAYPETLEELDEPVTWAAGYLATMPAVAQLASKALGCRSARSRQLLWNY